jgi:hypothetical protein
MIAGAASHSRRGVFAAPLPKYIQLYTPALGERCAMPGETFIRRQISR